MLVLFLSKIKSPDKNIWTRLFVNFCKPCFVEAQFSGSIVQWQSSISRHKVSPHNQFNYLCEAPLP